MDKNIKAELSALRSEVLTNLKSLELVVNNINSKLGQLDIDDAGIPTKYKGELKIAFEVYNSKQAHTEIVV